MTPQLLQLLLSYVMTGVILSAICVGLVGLVTLVIVLLRR